jgi:hypothetical protein
VLLTAWTGCYVPKGTPREPGEFAAFTLSKKERWGNIIRRANIRLE